MDGEEPYSDKQRRAGLDQWFRFNVSALVLRWYCATESNAGHGVVGILGGRLDAAGSIVTWWSMMSMTGGATAK